MTVTKILKGSVAVLKGTDNEVAQALSDENVPLKKIITVVHNGTNTTLMYFGGFSFTSWTPAEITTTAWYEASDNSSPNIITSAGNEVFQWSDKSGNGYNLTQGGIGIQPTTGTHTLNGMNTIRFDGINDYIFSTTGMPSGDLTIFAVHDFAGGAQEAVITNGGNYASGTQAMIRPWTINYGQTQETIPPVSADPVIMMLRGNASVMEGSGNGDTVISTAVTLRDTMEPNIILGASSSGTTPFAYYPGNIAEIIIFNSFIDDDTRRKVEGYLAWKWGLVGNLPAGHPYKSNPPAV